VEEGSARFVLILEVEDTGPGIGAWDLPHIFAEFSQTRAGKKVEGTGLGLAISKRFSELMGGSLTVSSALGSGSLFRLELPLERTKASLQERHPQWQIGGMEPGSTPLRLLLVDDKPDNLFFIREVLEPIGFELRTAEDGASGLAIAEAWNPHAVLLDLLMPVMDGYEMTRRLRKRPSGEEVFILAITASAFEEDRKEAIAAGADAVLSKPFQPDELLGILGKALDIRYRLVERRARDQHVVGLGQGARQGASGLSKATIKLLRHAIQSGEALLIGKCLDELEELDESAAQTLRHMSDRFDYDAIEAWIICTEATANGGEGE